MNPYREPSPRDDYGWPNVGDRVRHFDGSEFDGDGVVEALGEVSEIRIVSVLDGLDMRRKLYWPEDLYVVRRAA